MKKETKYTIVTAKNGRKYAYLANEHVWDKDKQQCRTKLTYYGTVDDNGVVHPKKQKLVKANIREDSDSDRNLSLVSEKNIGMTRVLSKVSEEIRLTEALKESFPKTWESILSLAMYHVSTGSNAAYLFEEWAEETETPLGRSVLTSQMISELYKDMDKSRRLDFLYNWRNKASTGNACFHDITSISSYSLKSDIVEYGYNRDKEDLPQINIGMISDSGNRLPIYYKIHDGSINDVSTLRNILKEGYAFNMKNLTFVMDKGFFSKGNIDALYSFNYHFIVSMAFTTNAAFEAVDKVRDTIRHPRNVVCTSNKEYLYASSFETHWGSKDLNRKCKIHVYTKLVNDIAIRSGNLDLKLIDCLNELNNGEWNNAHVSLYAKYFKETVNSDGSKSYQYNDEAIQNSENKYSGYLCIVTDNLNLTSEQVIDIYRDKDGIEKVFDDIKNVQDCKRLNVQSRSVMEGKMFVIFIASILISEIRQRMKHNYKEKDSWTIDLIRKKLNKIQLSKVKIGTKASKGLYSLISSSQRAILSALLNVSEKDVSQTLKDAAIV